MAAESKLMASVSQPVKYERPELVEWRHASRNACNSVVYTCTLFQDFLSAGGPDAIKSLKGTIKKLKAELAEVEAKGQVQRYKALQLDLAERDSVNAALRYLLLRHFGVVATEEQLDSMIDAKVLKQDRLYGSSRELLMRENKALRTALEQRLITTRTAWPCGGTLGEAGAGGSDLLASTDQTSPAKAAGAGRGGAAGAGGVSGAGRGGAPSSKAVGISAGKLAGLNPTARAHMEVVMGLAKAGEELAEAEQAYQLPDMRHAEVMADDGSRRRMLILEEQVATLAGQKAQLMRKVAELESELAVAQRTAKAAQEEAAAQRRMRTEFLLNQDQLSADMRGHLAGETKRADQAEAAIEAARAEAREANRLAEERGAQAVAAFTEAKEMAAELRVKTEQIATLERHFNELQAILQNLGAHTTATAKGAEERFSALHAEVSQALAAAVSHATAARQAAEASVHAAGVLATEQRVLSSDVAGHKATTDAALRMLQSELAAAKQSAAVAERERRGAQKQLVAGVLLGRLEDRRMDKQLSKLHTTLPPAVAGAVSSSLAPLAATADDLQLGLQVANTQLHTIVAAGGHVGGMPAWDGREPGPAGCPGGGYSGRYPGSPPHGGSAGMLSGPDPMQEADDDTCRLLGASKQLRAALTTLVAANAAAPPGAEGLTYPGSMAMLMRQPVVDARESSPLKAFAAPGPAHLAAAPPPVVPVRPEQLKQQLRGIAAGADPGPGPSSWERQVPYSGGQGPAGLQALPGAGASVGSASPARAGPGSPGRPQLVLPPMIRPGSHGAPQASSAALPQQPPSTSPGRGGSAGPSSYSTNSGSPPPHVVSKGPLERLGLGQAPPKAVALQEEEPFFRAPAPGSKTLRGQLAAMLSPPASKAGAGGSQKQQQQPQQAEQGVYYGPSAVYPPSHFHFQKVAFPTPTKASVHAASEGSPTAATAGGMAVVGVTRQPPSSPPTSRQTRDPAADAAGAPAAAAGAQDPASGARPPAARSLMLPLFPGRL